MTAFSPKQRTVLSWWVPGNPNLDREAIVCDGAVRSGKTLAMGLSFFLWAMSCFNGQKFGVCGKTIASLRRNVLSEILPKLEGLGAKWKEKRTDNLLTVKFRGRENQFYVFGGRDESSASLIQGITFAGVLLDEVALMPRSFVEQHAPGAPSPGAGYGSTATLPGRGIGFTGRGFWRRRSGTVCGSTSPWRTTPP